VIFTYALKSRRRLVKLIYEHRTEKQKCSEKTKTKNRRTGAAEKSVNLNFPGQNARETKRPKLKRPQNKRLASGTKRSKPKRRQTKTTLTGNAPKAKRP